MFNRRAFLKSGLAALPVASITDLPLTALAEPSAPPSGSTAAVADGAAPTKPWQQLVRRVGQLNMTEHDPVEMNIEEWANYWQSLKVDVVFISVTGIIAYYPTKVPYFRRGKYLGDRDFFGECCDAAKKRGMRVVARMSPDLNWEEALNAHPEWAMRDAKGNALHSVEEPRLFRTCMFSTYMTDYIPAVMREVNSRYDVDAIYTNGWPPLGSLPVCHCQECSKLPPAGTPAYWEKFNERVLYLWKLYDSIAKEKKPTSFYFANLGAGAHAAPNLAELGKICTWFHADNQGRTEAAPIWECAMQGRVCNAVQDGKIAVNCTGAYATGNLRWRNAAKSPAELTMWFNETLASGMVLDNHFVGAEKGLGEDRRIPKVARTYFPWTVPHDRHLTTKRSLANIGLVMGQRTQLFYRQPGGGPVRDDLNGMYYALLEGRFAFDMVHEDRLDAEQLRKYRALILPNTALLSDAQCRQLAEYVKSGGSLLASFETSMYDEKNVRRNDFGLADVLGIHQTGAVVGTNGNLYYSRIEKQHPILDGFEDTNWLPGAENRVPVSAVSDPVLTVVPGFVAYPPELAYPPVSHTTEPAVVLRELGKSRLVYFAGDIERTMWRAGNTDLSQLLQNAVRWVTGGEAPYIVSGDGLVETFGWETEAGYAVHVLNYNNPNAHRGSMRKSYPIGEQKVTMRVPAEAKVTRVELLRAGRDIPFHHAGETIEFAIPRVDDYEVAAIHAS
jgi:Uncharacterised BCR, COG1649./Beta-galactosidase trimerisation domain.